MALTFPTGVAQYTIPKTMRSQYPGLRHPRVDRPCRNPGPGGYWCSCYGTCGTDFKIYDGHSPHPAVWRFTLVR
jgi:hypothetical protein